MLDVLQSDLDRYAPDRTFAARASVMLLNLGFHAVVLYRLSRWLHVHGLGLLGAVVAFVNSVYTGAQVSARAAIGPSFVIYHPRGVVVGATAVIGDHCTLVHGNLIGQLYGGGDRPVIGNHFYAGTGSKVLGRITIGDDVTVGANSVVIRSLPDGVTASGIPARVVFRRRPVVAPPPAVESDALFPRLVNVLRANVELAASIDPIAPATRLLGEGVGMDSVDVLRLVCALEEEFGVTIDEGDVTVDHFRTAGDLACFLERRTKQ